MELKEFKRKIHKCFVEHGFEKIKNKYYRNGSEFLCMIDMYRSNFSASYIFDFYFFIGHFEKPYNINQESAPTYTPYVGGRFLFTDIEKCFCDYSIHDELKLKELLDKNFKDVILPPFNEGKRYLLKHFGTLYRTFLDVEMIKKKLES